jgi:hypothetical protein
VSSARSAPAATASEAELCAPPGRIITIVVMLVGIGFVAMLTAAAAERFMRAQRAERRELEGVERRADEIAARLAALERRRCSPLPPPASRSPSAPGVVDTVSSSSHGIAVKSTLTPRRDGRRPCSRRWPATTGPAKWRTMRRP